MKATIGSPLSKDSSSALQPTGRCWSFSSARKPGVCFVAAILDNTRRRGAGRAIVDKKAMQREGVWEGERGFPLPSPYPLPPCLRSPARTRDPAPQKSKMAPD